MKIKDIIEKIDKLQRNIDAKTTSSLNTKISPEKNSEIEDYKKKIDEKCSEIQNYSKSYAKREIGNLESINILDEKKYVVQSYSYKVDELKDIFNILDILHIEIKTWFKNQKYFKDKEKYMTSNEIKRSNYKKIFIGALIGVLVSFLVLQILEWKNVFNINLIVNCTLGDFTGFVEFIISILLGIYEMIDDMQSKKINKKIINLLSYSNISYSNNYLILSKNKDQIIDKIITKFGIMDNNFCSNNKKNLESFYASIYDAISKKFDWNEVDIKKVENCFLQSCDYFSDNKNKDSFTEKKKKECESIYKDFIENITSHLIEFVIDSKTKKLIKFNNINKLKKVIIPLGIKGISSGAFQYNDLIKKIILSKTIIEIDEKAFSECKFLKTIFIPTSVTSIGKGAFYNCTSLTKVTLPFIDTYFGYYFGASSYNDNSSYVPKSLKIVTILGGESIPENAFEGCENIKKIKIPNSVSSIEKRAFFNCCKLKTIIIPKGVNYIADSTFEECKNIKKIKIPDSVLSIGERAFFNCEKIKNLVIPINVKSVGGHAFSNCPAPIYAACKKRPKEWSGNKDEYKKFRWNCTFLNRFFDCTESIFLDLCTGIIIVDILCSYYNYCCLNVSTYNYFFFWMRKEVAFGFSFLQLLVLILFFEFFIFIFGICVKRRHTTCRGISTCILIYIFVVYANQLFERFNMICLVSNDYAIYFVENENNCELKKIETFDNNYSRQFDITIPNTFHGKPITKIDSGFSIDGYNVNIKFEKDSPLEYIEDYAFKGLNNLTGFSFPQNFNMQGVGKNIFYQCNSLSSITFPYLDTYVGYYFGANNYMSNYPALPFSLRTISVLGGESIPENAFYNCKYLSEINISKDVSSIGKNAFYGCEDISHLSIPAPERYLGYYFGSESYKDSSFLPFSLRSISIVDGERLPDFAFYLCTHLRSIELPASINKIGDSAFYNCHSMESVNYKGSIGQWTNIDFYNEYSNPLCIKSAKLFINGDKVNNIVLENISEVKRNAFIGFDTVESIKIIGESTIIEKGAFEYCKALKELVIPCLERPLNEYFGASENSTKILVPVSLKSITILGGNNIPNKAFYGITSINNITFSKSIKAIGENAFTDCSSLERIDYIGTISEWANITFSNAHSNPLAINNSRLYIDNQLQNQIVISDITEIKAYAFYDCDFIESATISNGVTKIGSKAFYGCDSLRTIVIPKSVVNIENDAFSNCTSLERVDYLGTMDDWKNINFENNSSNPLSNKNAKLYVDGVLAQQKNIVLENSFVIKSDKGYFYPNASFP